MNRTYPSDEPTEGSEQHIRKIRIGFNCPVTQISANEFELMVPEVECQVFTDKFAEHMGQLFGKIEAGNILDDASMKILHKEIAALMVLH